MSYTSEYRIIKKTISVGLGCPWRTDDAQDPCFYSLAEIFFDKDRKIIFIEEIIKNQKLDQIKSSIQEILKAYNKDILDVGVNND